MILNLFDRMKLPFRKNKEFLKALYDILGFYPHNIEIYRIAFSHKSLTYRRDANPKDRKGNKDKRSKTENTAKPLNNERLEYLGDAVLETVVSDILFRHFEHKREGFLTSTRSKIVQREALNRLAEQMGLENLILAAQGTRMAHTNIGGNAFEALMGAIYLDRGYKFCHWFITHRVIGPYVDLDSVAQKEVNFKSKLLEWCQKNRISTNFRDFTSNDGDKGFRSTIVLEGITVGKGSGRSKKESQQVASKDALVRMRKEQKLYDSIFRAKEKRTAMEADESFALPKLDEIETVVKRDRGGKKPVLENERSDGQELSPTDAAYDAAYNESAKFEVISGSEDTESEYSEYATDIQPEATEEERMAALNNGTPLTYTPAERAERPEPQTKAQRKRERNRAAKTVGDAVKTTSKGRATESATETAANTKERTVKAADSSNRKEKPVKPEKGMNAEKPENRPTRKGNMEEVPATPKEENTPKTQPDETGSKASEKAQLPAKSENGPHDKENMQLTPAERSAARQARRERRKAKENSQDLVAETGTIPTDTASKAVAGEDTDEPLITLQATITAYEDEEKHEDVAGTEVISQVITEAEEVPSPLEILAEEPATEPQDQANVKVVPPAAANDNRQALQEMLTELVENRQKQSANAELADDTSSAKPQTEGAPESEYATTNSAEDEADASPTELGNEAIASEQTSQAEANEPTPAEGTYTEANAESYEEPEAGAISEEKMTGKPEEADQEAEETETASEENETETAIPQSALSSTRPILRHLTLDDFVFGTTDGVAHETEEESEAADEEDSLHDEQPRKNGKRKPRRRNRRSKSAGSNHDESETSEQAPTTESRNNGHQTGANERSDNRQKSRKEPKQPNAGKKAPAEKETQPSKEEQERAAKRRAAQRRRRRQHSDNRPSDSDN